MPRYLPGPHGPDEPTAADDALWVRRLEELSACLAESMNRTMYVLSIVTAIFLPLGLLTGLLGINVGGMPGEESEQAFAYVCVLMGVMALGLWELFRRKRLV